MIESQLIVYHRRDLDGIAAGSILKSKFTDANMFGWDYGESFPMNLLDPLTTVYMTDVTPDTIDDLIEIKNHCKKIILIDHHSSFQQQHNSYLWDIAIDPEYGENPIDRYVYDETKAASRLCWEYCYPDKTIPTIIKHIAQYDIWDHSDPDTNALQLGAIASGLLNPEHDYWTNYRYLSNNTIAYAGHLLTQGRAIQSYQENKDKESIQLVGFEGELNGHPAYCINLPVGNLITVKSAYDKSKYDILVVYSINKNGKIKVSLRSDSVDVRPIAKSYDGGGHKYAAGFFTNQLDLKTILITAESSNGQENKKNIISFAQC